MEKYCICIRHARRQRGTDIYYCGKKADGDWDTPVNLGDINTAGNERTPTLTAKIIFISAATATVGMGGLDIFRSVIVNGRPFSPAKYGYPINSPRDDYAYVLADLTSGYFASNRAGGLGSDDIYKFTIEKLLVTEPATKPEFKLKGIVYEKDTRRPITNAIVSLENVNNNALKIQTDTDGKFEYVLEAAANYNLTGEKTGFLRDAARVTTIT